MSGRSLLLNFSGDLLWRGWLCPSENGSAFLQPTKEKKETKEAFMAYLFTCSSNTCEGRIYKGDLSMRFSTYCPFFEYITFALIL